MKKSKLAVLGALTAAVMTAITVPASALDELVLTPSDTNGLVYASDGQTPVKFKEEPVLKGTAGRQADGMWVLGGDLGDTGITIEKLKQYKYFEIDYTCKQTDTDGNEESKIMDGLMIGPIFKVHIGGRQADNGSDVYNDYLGEAWLPYGPDGTEGRGKTVNSLETIYRTQVQTEGTISIPVQELESIFESDSDYLLGIGIGVDCKNYINEKDNKKGFSIEVSAVRLTDSKKLASGENVLKAGQTPAVTQETTAAAQAQTDEQSQPEETTAAASGTAAQTKAPTQSRRAGVDTGMLMVVLIAAIVVAVGAIAGVIVYYFKSKNRRK